MIAYTPVPVLTMGPFHFSTHALLMAAGFLVALFFARRKGKRIGLTADVIDGTALVGVLAGLIGARVIYIITLGQEMGFIQMLKVWEGGLSSHGGYVFGTVGALVYLLIRKQPLLKYTDTLAPYVLVGWAIGRIGCFLNWDSYGRLPVGVCPHCVVVGGTAHHPTQLYEAVGYMAGFDSVWILGRVRTFFRREGMPTALAALFFAATRFVVDFFRADPPEYLLVSRIITVVIMVGAAGYLIYGRIKHYAH